MKRSTTAKLLAGAAALGTAAFLIGPATGTTGAYFTESKAGTINASTGGVHVNTDNLTLNFANLLPGQFQTINVGYTAAGTGPEDIWFVLPTDGSAAALNGVAGSHPGGDKALGRYGHFALTAPDGSFTSFNLATAGTGDHAGDTCTTDPYGRGGSDAQPANRSDYTVAFCPVPNAILLSYGINPGASGTVSITFGFTKLLTGPQDSALGLVAPFKIVATQHGIAPSDPNN